MKKNELREQIRNDLKDIKYYYARKNFIDKSSEIIGRNEVYEKVEKYNKMICLAPMRMYDLYVSLYKENNTHESLAESICYSVDYVAKLNQQLVKFFEKKIKEMEVNENV